MVDVITFIYLAFMFLALYMFSFFIILTLKNRSKLFAYPEHNKGFSVTVIIPAHNEEDSIEDTLKHVYDLEYDKDKLEVIVANNASTDRTLEIIKNLMKSKKYKNLKIIDEDKPGKARVLNIAIKQSKGELIAVVDSDSFPSRESLKKLTGFFNDPKMGAVTSFVKVRNKERNFFAKIQGIEYLILGWTRKLLDFIDSVYVTNGPLSLYRKKYINTVGGFDTETVTEDIDITWNMLDYGYNTAMCLDAHVTTVVPHRYRDWFRQRVRWGLGGLQAIRKYRKSFFKRGGMFGVFILPFVSLTIVLSIFAFLFGLYLISKFAIARVLSVSYSVSNQATIFSLQDINLYPSVLIFFLVVLFTLSMSYSMYVLRATDFESNLNVRKFFNLIFYTLIYLSIYPTIWFASIYRYIKKDYRW